MLEVCQRSSGSLLTVFWWSSGSLLVDHQKMNISFFNDLGGIFCISVTIHRLDHLANHHKRCQVGFKSIDQPSQSSEVEHNPKMGISFLWLERGGGWGSRPWTNPADHQKLNVIQKQAFHFFGWRGVVDGV